MPIRPLDIRRKEFRNGFRGYDANQVDDFLDTVADEFERTYNENQRMREEVSGLRDRLQQFEDLEGSIRAALVHAEQAANDLRRSANQEAEDVRENARREADLTIRDAQARSQQMLTESSSRIERVQDSYEALQDAKKSFANDFRHLLKTHMDMMENMEVSSAKEVEASLRERLDAESVAAVHEAAQQEEPAATAEPEDAEGEEPAFGTTNADAADLDDPGATRRIETASVGTEDAPEDRAPEQEPADEQETRVLHPEETAYDAGSTGGPEDEEPRRVAWSTETSEADERAADEPVAEEPETEPSTAEAGETEATAVGEPRASEEVEREEPTLAEESSSHEFFDRDNSGTKEDESRIARASRFLRRRD